MKWLWHSQHNHLIWFKTHPDLMVLIEDLFFVGNKRNGKKKILKSHSIFGESNKLIKVSCVVNVFVDVQNQETLWNERELMIFRVTKVQAHHCAFHCTVIRDYTNERLLFLCILNDMAFVCCFEINWLAIAKINRKWYWKRRKEENVERIENDAKYHIVSIQLPIESVAVMFMKENARHCFQSHQYALLNGNGMPYTFVSTGPIK